MATNVQTRNAETGFLARAVGDRIALATAAGKTLRQKGDLATSAGYDSRSRRLLVELVSGVGLSIPVAKLQGLADAPAAVIRTVRVEGSGYGLHWPSLDLDLAVPDLIAGCFGSRAWMAALGRRGGAATSTAKRRASRRDRNQGAAGDGASFLARLGALAQE